jgi:hypothetical protein
MQEERTRKRSRVGGTTSDSNDAGSSPSQGVLDGVIVCLTGISQDEKDFYHALTEKLGGQYTRDMDPTKNTHLVAVSAEGAKYEAAVSSKRMQIVLPSWLDACSNGQRGDESEHTLQVLQAPQTTCSLGQLLLEKYFKDTFSSCNFLLVGFGEDDIKLGRLIRRGLGTIFWQTHEKLTHVVVEDHATDSTE